MDLNIYKVSGKNKQEFILAGTSWQAKKLFEDHFKVTAQSCDFEMKESDAAVRVLVLNKDGHGIVVKT
jgi:hypothetical protein